MITLALILFSLLFIIILLIPAKSQNTDPNKTRFDQAIEEIANKANDEITTLKELGKIEIIGVINEYKINRMKGIQNFSVDYIFALLKLYRLNLGDVDLSERLVKSWWTTEWFSRAIIHYTELNRIRRKPFLKYFVCWQKILLGHDLKHLDITVKEFIRIYRAYRNKYLIPK